MDHQKDNQRIGQDVKGQSFGPYLSNVHNNVDPMTLNYISKKSEKLTTALYMVTDVMNEQEPMKWKLRESGVELLSDIMLAAAASSSERLTLLRLVEKKIEQVVSFLDVAWTARMMSEMNAAILKKEYVAIKDTIEKELSRTVGVGGSVLHESFFHVTRELPSRSAHVEENGIDTREVRASGVSYKNVQENEATRTMEAQKDISSTETSKDTVPMSAVAPVERKNIGASSFAVSTSGEGSRSMSPATFKKERSTLIMEVRPGVTRSDANTVARDDRRKIILALIKQKPSLTVKDIVKSIPGYSEKTIQRELLAMVADGILVKRGERRWSTYSLAQ